MKNGAIFSNLRGLQPGSSPRCPDADSKTLMTKNNDTILLIFKVEKSVFKRDIQVRSGKIIFLKEKANDLVYCLDK